MKLMMITFASLLINFVSIAQSKSENWPELSAFHQVMAQTFHPSEEGNLEPIKTRINEMVLKAEALKASKVPKEYDNNKVRKSINELVTKSKKLQSLIQTGGTDAQITKALSSLHDTFHKIVGLCKDNKEHEHGHDHNHEHPHEHKHEEKK